MNIICKKECIVEKDSFKGNGWALFTGVLVILMPKCAFCWAAYMNIFSSAGIVINYQPWFVPVSLVLFLLTLIKLLITAIRTKNFICFGLAFLAGMLIILQKLVAGIDIIKILAIVLMAAAILMNKFLIVYKQVIRFMSNNQIQK